MNVLAINRKIAALAAVAVVGLTSFALTTPARAQESAMMNTITVTGIGSATGAPDVAYLDLGVEILDADLSKAFSQVGEQVGAITSAITALGVSAQDIQTSNLYIYPQDSYDDSGMVSGRMYRVGNTISITVKDISKVEDIISAAVSAGANTINSLTFGIQDPSALEAQARQNAVENAKARAEQLAQTLGVTVGAPVMISEIVGGGQPIPMFDRVSGAGVMNLDASTPVSAGQLSVSVQIEVSFSIGG